MVKINARNYEKIEEVYEFSVLDDNTIGNYTNFFE